MAAEGGDAVFNMDADGVEDIAVSDAVIVEPLLEFGLKLAVGDVGAGDLNQVADRGDCVGAGNALGGVGFVLVERDGSGESGDAVFDGDFDVLEIGLVEPGRGVVSGGRILRGYGAGGACSVSVLRKAQQGSGEQGREERGVGDAHFSDHEKTSDLFSLQCFRRLRDRVCQSAVRTY